MEALNEPWQFTPIEALQRTYWEGYKIVREIAPHWVYIMYYVLICLRLLALGMIPSATISTYGATL